MWPHSKLSPSGRVRKISECTFDLARSHIAIHRLTITMLLLLLLLVHLQQTRTVQMRTVSVV